MGGGGAGGYISDTMSLGTGTYTVAVGSGGRGGSPSDATCAQSSYYAWGYKGDNSVFHTETAVGGGGGGLGSPSHTVPAACSMDGGSGGGAGYSSSFIGGTPHSVDVPIYTNYRAEQYQSGTTSGDATIMDDDLTTDPGFVYMNSGTTAQHDSGNGEIDIAYSGTNNPAYAYYDLGTPLGDTWSMQFDLRRNSGSNQDFAIGFADDSGWTGTPGDLTSWGSGDWAGVRTLNNCAVTVYEYNDGSSNGGSQGTNCPSIGTWETYTVTYDSNLLKVEVTNHSPNTSGDYETSSTGATIVVFPFFCTIPISSPQNPVR